MQTQNLKKQTADHRPMFLCYFHYRVVTVIRFIEPEYQSG